MLTELNLMTVNEVAEYLRVSKMTVYRLIEKNEIQSVRVGRSLRVAEDAVERYVRGIK